MKQENSSRKIDMIHADIARYAVRSEQGARQSQQDSVYVGTRKNRMLAVVCDGMGGMQGGEQAGKLAVGMLQESFQNQDISNDEAFFRRCVQETDRAIYNLWDGSKPLRAGTTIAAVMINNRKLTWLSVGDLVKHTAMVLVVVLVMSAVIWLLDLGFSAGVKGLATLTGAGTSQTAE